MARRVLKIVHILTDESLYHLQSDAIYQNLHLYSKNRGFPVFNTQFFVYIYENFIPKYFILNIDYMDSLLTENGLLVYTTSIKCLLHIQIQEKHIVSKRIRHTRTIHEIIPIIQKQSKTYELVMATKP